MIEFIRKNKDLRDIFKEAESSFSEKKTKRREFYQILCDELIDDLNKKDFRYEESLIKVSISFVDSSLSYKFAFPLIDTTESQTQIFIKSLKMAMKKSIPQAYKTNLCLQSENETFDIVLEVTENNKKKEKSQERLGEV